MRATENVPLLVLVPRSTRTRVRVEAAHREITIAAFVREALEAAAVRSEEQRLTKLS